MSFKLSIVGVGPQKTASTWLFKILEESGKFCFPIQVKETFFWDRSFSKGENWYFSHFDCSTNLPLAEIGPTYFHSTEGAERIYHHNPNIKVIVTLRNPVVRSVSLYKHHWMRGRVGNDFWSAVKSFPEIVDASHYAIYLPIWFELFCKQNVLILLQDDIAEDPASTLSRVQTFIGEDLNIQIDRAKRVVNPASLPRSQWLSRITTKAAGRLRDNRLYWVINTAKKIGLKEIIYSGRKAENGPRVPVEVINHLRQNFLQDIKYIESLLDRDLSDWR